MNPFLTIIIGPMFSGKSSELIRRVRRSRIKGYKVLVLKPDIDNRYSESQISSHDGVKIDCISTETSLMDLSIVDDDVNLIAVDEAQFFSGLNNFVRFYLDKGVSFIIAGLDGDYRREKFGEILDLIPLSSKVIKLSAICNVCGKKAPFTFRKTREGNQVVVGESDIYEARCRGCWEKGMKKNQIESEFIKKIR